MSNFDSNSNNSVSGVTQLEFYQAMNDFKNMFPEMEEDVIEAVLRSNNGVVDSTIDQLLQMNHESLASKKTKKISSNNLYNVLENVSSVDTKSYKKNLPFLNNESNKSPLISNESLRYKHRWEPPLLGELSHSFLRIDLNETQRKLNNHLDQSLQGKQTNDTHLISSSLLQQKMEENERNRQITSLNDDPELAQFLEDERFAILLQNEEFVRELRLNREFMSALESDNSLGSQNSFDHQFGQTTGASSSGQYVDSDAAFKERLRNMGKMSKRKFTQLARLFSGRKKNFKQLEDSKDHHHYHHHQNFYYDQEGNDDNNLNDFNQIDGKTTKKSSNIKF
ncbi:Cuedc1p [Blomia tropicalis]|nr:Cuedc1p [Blomia tropicalis]